MEENSIEMEEGPITHPLLLKEQQNFTEYQKSSMRKRKLGGLNQEAFG